jgi:tRNA(Ile)-lysidine synthase
MKPPLLVRKVSRWLHRQGLPPGSTVVAVSGGPDSVALLRALLHLRRDQAPIVIAHLNHRLRGAESDADETFVRDLHAGLVAQGHASLKCHCDQIDVAAAAKAERGNLESVARRIRYDWLARIAKECNVPRVITGHTADDQAETVLHRLLRGTGLKGLAGIAARRELVSGVELVRPLLCVRRTEVMEYLHGEGQTYRIDRSNQDLAYTRNRIRHELLPLLATQYNPAIVSVLGRLAEQAEAVHRDDEALARELLAKAERPRAGRLLIFDRHILMAAPRRLVCEAFRLVWQREGWPTGPMSFERWDRLAAVTFGECTGVDLPGRVRARGREQVVQLGRLN